MTKKTYTPQQKLAFDKDKWSMQNHAANLLVGHRVSFCLRSPISKKESIKVVTRSPIKKDGDARYGFTGLQCCGSIHGCPMCSSRIALHRENEVRTVSDWAKSKGYMVAMLTLTHSHQKFDLLRWQLDGLLGYKEDGKLVRGAMYHFRNSRAFRNLKLVGDIKKFEATHGQNGWHPHHHIMLIIDPKDCGNIDQFSLYKAWASACEKVGLSTPSIQRGLQLDIAKNDDDLSGYIAKMGTWDMAKEMTKDQSKKSKIDGSTQWQLLRLSNEGCKKSGSLFVEYVESTKGVKSLIFSRGLKDLASVDNSSDQVLSEDESSVQSLVFDFVDTHLCIRDKKEVYARGIDLWYLVLSYGSRFKVLEVAKKGGSNGVKAYLFRLIEKHDLLDDMPYMQPVKIRSSS